MDKAWNVFDNAISPIDFRGDGGVSRVMGSAEYIAIEVLVSKIVRSVLKMENRGIMDLAFIHLLSIPFLGGLSAPFGPITALAQGNQGYTQALTDGAKGIPAVLVAQWIIATSSKGFHVPWFNMKDVLITAGSKTLSRPIVRALWGILGQLSAQQGFDVIDALVNRQVAVSSIRRTG